MTEEEIMALQADVEALKGDVASRDARIAELEGQNTELVTQVAEISVLAENQDTELAVLKEGITAKDTEISSLKASLDGAVGKYRESVLASNPGIPSELLTGDSIEDIDASLGTAQALVEKVKTSLETQQRNTPVPPGAPPRTPPDLSSMSSMEKIRQGISS